MLLAGSAQRLQPGHSRHSHVGNHHADRLATQDLQCPLPGGNRDSIKSLTTQKRIQQAALARIIVDDQDPRSFGDWIASFGGHRFSATMADCRKAESLRSGCMGLYFSSFRKKYWV